MAPKAPPALGQSANKLSQATLCQGQLGCSRSPGSVRSVAPSDVPSSSNNHTSTVTSTSSGASLEDRVERAVEKAMLNQKAVASKKRDGEPTLDHTVMGAAARAGQTAQHAGQTETKVAANDGTH